MSEQPVVQTSSARLEVFVEPFEEAHPGPHVHAVVDVLAAAGIDADLGAFATTADADLDALVESVGALVRDAFAQGATSLQLRLERSDDPGSDWGA